jgi:diguanylate cyclase (GGDEF)-like protein
MRAWRVHETRGNTMRKGRGVRQAPAVWRSLRGDAGPAMLALLIGGVLVVGYFLLPSPDLQDLAYQVPGMLAVPAVLAGIALHRPSNPWPWVLLAAGLALTTTGDWTWVVLARVYELEPFPSLADAFYLGGMGLTVAAVVWMVRGRIPGGDRAGVLDALIVAVGVGLVSWTFLMAPIVADPTAAFADIAFALAYPMLDILLLGVLVRIVLAPGPRVPSLTFLMGALVAFLASDFPYAFLALSDGYYTGHIVDAGWLIGSVLWATAALHPSMREVAEPVEAAEARLSAWRLILLAGASLMAPAVLVIQWVTGSPIDVPVIAAGCVVLFLLVIARLGGVVSDLRSTLRQRQRLERELEHRALHDPLTGLANRVLFSDRLGRALAQRDERVAALFLDLDDFKTINDTHGHQAGDELLGAVAEVLRRNVRPEDTVARLGGDEFAILVERGASEGTARVLADRLLTALRRPVRVAGRDRAISASIGISLGTSGVADAETLMREADIAMYVAKGEGKGGSSIFDPRTHASVVRSIGLREDLERAIRHRQFELQYQPMVDTGSGELAAVEALVRWRHPVRGLLGPNEFIGVAESTGSIIALGQWIFEEACRQAAAWSRAGSPLADGRFMSINLSTIQLTHPGFVEFVFDTVERAGLPPGKVLVEVTESANPDADAVVETLRQLHAHGIRLAIDDFGTGYASMGRLLRTPFEMIKIDQSLVSLVATDPRAESVVTGITDLARRLGAVCIAEGVEDAEQLVRLRQMGCQLAQGFHFSSALPPAELEALLGTETRGRWNRLVRRVVDPRAAS